ncbi:hypothetical protein EV182_008112, partial [Spiromyces aspiralis]
MITASRIHNLVDRLSNGVSRSRPQHDQDGTANRHMQSADSDEPQSDQPHTQRQQPKQHPLRFYHLKKQSKSLTNLGSTSSGSRQYLAHNSSRARMPLYTRQKAREYIRTEML